SYVNARFALGAIACSAVTLGALARRYERILAPTLPLAAAILAWTINARHIQPSLTEAFAFAMGTVDRAAYIRARVPDAAAAEYVNANTPADSRVLIATLSRRTAMYDRRVYWSDYWLQDSFRYDSAERLAADVRRMGVSHIVLEPLDPPWCARSYI